MCKFLLGLTVGAFVGIATAAYAQPLVSGKSGFLATGKYTLVECYSKTVMLASWMTVLVGDPLYNPYARSPRLRPEQVQPSPKGSRFLPR